MSSFNQNINQFQQFIINVRVFQPTQNQSDHDKAFSSAFSYRALIDTGANRSGISQKIVTDVGLSPYKYIKLNTAGTPYTAPLYSVGMVVSVTETAIRPEKQKDGSIVEKPISISETSRGYAEIPVTSFPDIGTDRGFDIILGMDMLMNFHITIYRGNIIISI